MATSKLVARPGPAQQSCWSSDVPVPSAGTSVVDAIFLRPDCLRMKKVEMKEGKGKEVTGPLSETSLNVYRAGQCWPGRRSDWLRG